MNNQKNTNRKQILYQKTDFTPFNISNADFYIVKIYKNNLL